VRTKSVQTLLQRLLYGSYYKENLKPSAASFPVNRYQFKSEVDAFNCLILIFNWIFVFVFIPEYFNFFIFRFGPVFKILKHFKVPRISRERHYICSLFNAVTRMFLRNIYCMKIFGRGGWVCAQ
jgi:hypothetical protein